MGLGGKELGGKQLPDLGRGGGGAGADTWGEHMSTHFTGVCNMLDLESIIPGAFSMLFDLSILSLQPSLPPESPLAVYPFPGSSLTPHSSWGPDSHSGSSFHLTASGPPTLAALA